MIKIEGIGDCAPTIALRAALTAHDPQLVSARDNTLADVTIVPRLQDKADETGWYDLYWCHPAVDVVLQPGDDEPMPEPTVALIGRIDAIKPPPYIPAETRLAAMPPVTLDGWTEAQIRVYGGEDRVREHMEARRRVAAEQDRTTEAYDWAALAERVAAMVRRLPPRKLTPGQRAQAAVARLREAHLRVAAERESVAALVRNAERAGEPLGDLRQVLALVDA